MNTQCRQCGQIKQKIRAERRQSRGFTHRDEKGRRWCGKLCPDCLLKHYTIVDRARGHRSRDDLSLVSPKHKKGRDAELIAAKFFEELGFKVELTKWFGPDLICSKKDRRFTVEVKSAIKNRTNWRVHAVQSTRLKDDYVAIVLPSGKIHIEDMAEHLTKCCKSGERQITKLVKLYNNI